MRLVCFSQVRAAMDDDSPLLEPLCGYDPREEETDLGAGQHIDLTGEVVDGVDLDCDYWRNRLTQP